jgi:predicted site-specific integrase-resolvase
MERLYTLKEAKMLLGATTRTIQRWDKEGKRLMKAPMNSRGAQS